MSISKRQANVKNRQERHAAGGIPQSATPQKLPIATSPYEIKAKLAVRRWVRISRTVEVGTDRRYLSGWATISKAKLCAPGAGGRVVPIETLSVVSPIPLPWRVVGIAVPSLGWQSWTHQCCPIFKVKESKI